ncbi:MAG TPA: PIG-L deacetylase family protein [Acidimicrobiales bacterium]|nr:PIG-L deacetylase family protein [Acidimicrobiales bacterium]
MRADEPSGIPLWLEHVLEPVKLPVSTLVGTSIGRFGADATRATARRSCLVLAPHPDDETFGCGVTIMRKVDAGTPVQVAVVTDGSTYPPHKSAADNIATRDAELHAACKSLGLDDRSVVHLSFPETQLHLAGDTLVDAVSDLVKSSSPDDVLVTSEADPHRDHAALGEATRRALAGTSVRVCLYPIWQWERPRSWLRTLQGSSRPERVSTAGYLDRKRKAVDAYSSQFSVAAGGELTEKIGLTPSFIRRFMGSYEVFFPVPQ